LNASIREREERKSRDERRLTVTLFVTFVTFIVCSIPPATILILGERVVYTHEIWF
jgi:hypothetical protein